MRATALLLLAFALCVSLALAAPTVLATTVDLSSVGIDAVSAKTLPHTEPTSSTASELLQTPGNNYGCPSDVDSATIAKHWSADLGGDSVSSLDNINDLPLSTDCTGGPWMCEPKERTALVQCHPEIHHYCCGETLGALLNVTFDRGAENEIWWWKSCGAPSGKL